MSIYTILYIHTLKTKFDVVQFELFFMNPRQTNQYVFPWHLPYHTMWDTVCLAWVRCWWGNIKIRTPPDDDISLIELILSKNISKVSPMLSSIEYSLILRWRISVFFIFYKPRIGRVLRQCLWSRLVWSHRKTRRTAYGLTAFLWIAIFGKFFLFSYDWRISYDFIWLLLILKQEDSSCFLYDFYPYDIKGTVSRDFLYPVFFTNQLLLVP